MTKSLNQSLVNVCATQNVTFVFEIIRKLEGKELLKKGFTNQMNLKSMCSIIGSKFAQKLIMVDQASEKKDEIQ